MGELLHGVAEAGEGDGGEAVFEAAQQALDMARCGIRAVAEVQRRRAHVGGAAVVAWLDEQVGVGLRGVGQAEDGRSRSGW